MKTRLGGMRHEIRQGSNRRNRRRGRCRPRLSGCRPWVLTLTRDETELYVANGLSGDLSIIDTKTRKGDKIGSGRPDSIRHLDR